MNKIEWSKIPRKERGRKPEKKPARYVNYYCPACRRKMVAEGWRFADLPKPPESRACESPALCGYFGPCQPTTPFKEKPSYIKRTGGGERARAGRESQ